MNITPLEDWIVSRSGIGESSRERLEVYQLNRIRETIAYAKSRSRFYGEQLSACAETMDSLEDLQKLPFTFPYDLQQDPFRFLCVPQSEVKRIVTLRSTGTTGREKRIFFSEEDLEHTVDFFQYGMSCLTSSTDRIMVLLPGNSYGSIGDLLQKALHRAGIPCFVHGVVVNPEEAAKEIEKNNITSLVGIPVQVRNLSRMYGGIFKSNIKSVLLSTDYVPEVMIRELSHNFRCRVFTHYGMTEMGYGGGVECEALNGYHLREAELYFEIVNPATGEAVPDGEWGEVVFTTLGRRAMPLIRYRTGDIAAFTQEPCDCGTFLKTMKRVRGRLDNGIAVGKNKYLYLSELDEAVLRFPEVKDYKATELPDYGLCLELIMEKDVLQKTKDRIALKLQESIARQCGHITNLRIEISQDDGPEIITNSMTKRTVSGLR